MTEGHRRKFTLTPSERLALAAADLAKAMRISPTEAVAKFAEVGFAAAIDEHGRVDASRLHNLTEIPSIAALAAVIRENSGLLAELVRRVGALEVGERACADAYARLWDTGEKVGQRPISSPPAVPGIVPKQKPGQSEAGRQADETRQSREDEGEGPTRSPGAPAPSPRSQARPAALRPTQNPPVSGSSGPRNARKAGSGIGASGRKKARTWISRLLDRGLGSAGR